MLSATRKIEVAYRSVLVPLEVSSMYEEANIRFGALIHGAAVASDKAAPLALESTFGIEDSKVEKDMHSMHEEMWLQAC